jgi:hypothetical protein
MGSEDADVGRTWPIGNISKWRNRHSIGGELAFVKDRGDDRAEQALDNKKEAHNRAQSMRSMATHTNRQGDENVT